MPPKVTPKAIHKAVVKANFTTNSDIIPEIPLKSTPKQEYHLLSPKSYEYEPHLKALIAQNKVIIALSSTNEHLIVITHS